MKIIFLSNFFNHHQKELCTHLYSNSEREFSFVETDKMTKERLELGWGMQETPEYVKKLGNSIQKDECVELVNSADAVILGSASDSLVKERLKKGKSLYRYSERIYRTGYDFWRWPVRVIKFWWRFTRYKKIFILCASAYTAWDYARNLCCINRTYKWGYFPEVKRYSVETLMSKKKKNTLLWCGRFLELKHPELAINIADRLKKEGYCFELNIIGTGILEADLQRQVEEADLQDVVHFLGTMKPDEVRKHMEKSEVFLFTSDFNEGWGAVLNEAMNSGCAVVASHAIGSVPFLIKNKTNGLIFENENLEDLYIKVKFLIDHPEERQAVGVQAYQTMVDLWNPEVAAERFVKFAEEIEKKGYCDLYEDGPCSRAAILKNNWFKEM